MMKTFKEHGRYGGGRAIGKRLRGLIREACKQLKAHEADDLPKVMVVYDAVSAMPFYPFNLNDYLSPMDVDAAMFGEPIVRFWPDGKPNNILEPDFNHGGNRKVTHERSRYLSAVVCLLEGDELKLNIYHNPFADYPLLPKYFPNPKDRHFIKEKHQGLQGQHWSEYVGER
jgi:hypothetical protein